MMPAMLASDCHCPHAEQIASHVLSMNSQYDAISIF